MKRVHADRHDRPLFGSAASRLIEQEALANTEEHTLMRRAGAAVAALARAIRPHVSSAWVACGPGNNGGDGLEAAIHLQAAGLRVHVTLLADPHRMPPDSLDALARARAAGVPITDGISAVEPPDIAIDALLGLGGTRPPEGALADAIGRLNALPCPLLAVDPPSGLNADTGQPNGEACVRATHTLALLTLKPGLFTGAGRDHAGEVWLDDLGIDTRHQPPSAWLTGTPHPLAWRRHAQHKGSFGDVAVVGGASGMVGAALLAARAAHAAGAGRVYVNLLDDTAPAFDVERPELMFRRAWWQGPAESLGRSTVVCGCGGGDAVRSALPRLLSATTRLLLDADALNAIAADASLQQLLRAREGRGYQTVITPHPLEAARLLETSTSVVQSNRLGAAQQLADRFGCVVVLKGSGSIVSARGATPSINPTGNAALATAGTGDVLAGWLAGCWSASRTDALAAARHAVWLHGHAADLCTTPPLRAADLIEAMHQASLA
jgi:hydroxyethylthiazole kinase-like uncharacterized protein yjeF